MNPMVKDTLDGVLGNSFVEHKPGYGGPIHPWGYDHRQEEQAKRESGFYQARKTNPEVALMTPQEFEEWKKANGLPPTVRSTGALGGPVTPVPFPKYDRSIFGGNDSNTPVPFPNYDRNIFGGDASTMPVPFPALAKGKSPFSTPYWDKQDDIRKYLDNDRRLIDSLIRRGKIKV